MPVRDIAFKPRELTVPRRIGFLLIDGFALMSYSSAIEPFRAANVLADRPLYTWRHISTERPEVVASNGVRFLADHVVGENLALDTLFVCAGGNPALFNDAATFRWLRWIARRGVRIGGVSGGPFILARAQLLRGYRCTIHWEHMEAFIEAFPDVPVRPSLFEIDRDRLTCAGGIAALDMVHAILAEDHGSGLAVAVSEWFLQTHVRLGSGGQRMTLRERFGISNHRLIRVLEHMEMRVEEPTSRDALAALAGVSTRQLDRLFSKHLGTSLEAHYLAIRLDRARALLRQTMLPIVEVAMACGFASPSHFSRRYRARFGKPPIAERASTHQH